MMQTEEKKMENSMSMPMQDSMAADSEMSATPKKMDDMPECAIVGLIKNQMIVLEDDLREAKLRYADVALEKDNWSGKYERELDCKVIEGQISILTKLQRDFECMFTPSHSMSV
ncbi:MAG: hypothetical protein IJ681_04980 [Bacteroidales bacterium]|nr:hypothetical protein [Bacteroidales bacterium]